MLARKIQQLMTFFGLLNGYDQRRGADAGRGADRPMWISYHHDNNSSYR